MTCTEMVHNYTRGMCDCKQAEAVATARRRGLLRAAELAEEEAAKRPAASDAHVAIRGLARILRQEAGE